MYKRLISEINPFVQLFITFIIIFMLIISKSIFFLIILTIIILIIILISGISMNKFFNNIRNLLFIVIYLWILLAIILKGHSLFITTYKLFLIICIISIGFYKMTFDKLHYALNVFLICLSVFNFNVEKISYNVTINIYYLKYLIDSKKIIGLLGKKNNISFPSFKYAISAILISKDKIYKLEVSLKLKFYKLKKYKINFKDKILILLFVIFAIISFMKEVII